jgi:uncharacterized protein (TIGR02001 family)
MIPGHDSTIRRFRLIASCSRLGGLVALAVLALAPRAAAGPSFTATVVTDDRFRGRSVSEGRPTASVDAAFDAANGIYGGVAVTGVATRHDGPQFLEAQEYLGYVRRLSAGPSLDFGVTHSNYTEYWGGDGGTQYTELYAGVITHRLASHLYYSPNYFGRGDATLYGEVDTAVRPARNWRLSAHAGLLTYLSGPRPVGVHPTQYDWRIGLATALKALEVELSWSGAGPDPAYYSGSTHGRSGVTLAVRHSF